MLLIVTASIGKLYSQQPAVMMSDKAGWHKIGETTVNFKKEKDEIMIIGTDRFSSIKFKVTDAPINLISMDIIFDGGEKQSVNLNTHLKAAGESKVINLNGGERDLDKITFVYKTIDNKRDQKAHVEVWGLKNAASKEFKADKK